VVLESGFLVVGSDGDKPGVPGSTFPGDMEDLTFNTDSLGLVSESNAAVWRSDDGISWMRGLTSMLSRKRMAARS
jgi:hypothetical protein